MKQEVQQISMNEARAAVKRMKVGQVGGAGDSPVGRMRRDGSILTGLFT